MLTPLTDRVCIVTGGSKGIGRGLARRFGAVGCKVLVVARHGAQADAVAKEIAAAGGTASGFVGDVTDPASMDSMAAAAVERFGGIDILCANAGIFPSARLGQMTAADFDHVIGTNLKGMFLSITACLPALKARGKGRIVVTSSITGPITAYPGWTHYAASKAGQLGFIKTAALELAPSKITINAVMPGNIATEGLDGLGPDYRAKMEASVPLKKLGSLDDIAYAALYFASDEAAYVTGQTLVIDGGQVLPESLMALEEMGG